MNRKRLAYIVLIALGAIILIRTVHAADTSAGTSSWDHIWQEIILLVKQIWTRISYAAGIVNDWITTYLHVNIGQIIKFFADIIILILQAVIKIIQWLVGLVS